METQNRACANAIALPAHMGHYSPTHPCASAPSISGIDPFDIDTPILRLFRLRCQMRDAINQAAVDRPEASDEMLDAEVEAMSKIEARLLKLPTTCAADFAAKVIVDTSEAGCLSEWQTGQLWKEARALTGCTV